MEANKNDPLCKFHRASVLFGIGKLDEALEELEELKEIVPKESLVYFLIAKVTIYLTVSCNMSACTNFMTLCFYRYSARRGILTRRFCTFRGRQV